MVGRLPAKEIDCLAEAFHCNRATLSFTVVEMDNAIESRNCDQNERVMRVVRENIELLIEHQQSRREKMPESVKFAEKLTNAIGTMPCVYIHAAFFAAWIFINVGGLGIKPFDPFPFGLLTMMLSIEAIFLTLFVLIAQNRMQSESDNRSELDVQINLLTEYELTRLWRLTEMIADKLGVDRRHDEELKGLDADIDPQHVMQEIERTQENMQNGGAEESSEDDKG